MLNKTRTFAAAVAIAMVGSAGYAAVIDLNSGAGGDATGNGNQTGTFSSGGISGSILAGCGAWNSGTGNMLNVADCNGTVGTAKIKINSDGMGVDSRRDLSDTELDTSNGGEWLKFTFDMAVKLLNVDFTKFTSSDRYELIVDGVRIVDNSGVDPWTGLQQVNSWFAVRADMATCQNSRFSSQENDDDHGSNCAGQFMVRSFEVASVPLPAAGWLMLAGLGGLASMRRKARAA